MISKIFAFLGVLLISTPLCLAIGRTGNGGKVADFTDGFKASVPLNYQAGLDRSIPNDGLMITDPFGLGLSPTSIQFRKLSVEFSNLADKTRAEISDFFTNKSWTRFRVENQCIDVFKISNSTASNVIAVWGAQKGVIMLATDPMLQNQLLEITKSIELDEGACEWK